MIVIRRRGLKRFVAMAAFSIRQKGHSRMFPHNVNPHIRLHLTAVIATRTVPRYSGIHISRIGRIPMNLRHVLIEPTLLNKALRANATGVRLDSGVILLVIMHRVLACRDEVAIIKGAHKVSHVVLDVYNGCHCFVYSSPRGPSSFL